VRQTTRRPSPKTASAKTRGDAVAWTSKERAALAPLKSPASIQDFLDAVPYSADPFYRSPRTVLRDKKAHCFDGALFAAAALRQLGHPPLLVDLRAVRDDDHVLAVYQVDGHWGAIAKSNFVGLRFREPIFRNVRELALSYFEDYFNSLGEKTLREVSVPMDLTRFDRLDWCTCDNHLETIAERLDKVVHRAVLTPAMVRRLRPVDPRFKEAGMVGTDPAGLYKVEKR